MLSSLMAKVSELKKDVFKFKSKDFLHAALAGSALVIMADGVIDANEKSKMMGFIQNNEALSVYDASEVLKVWKEYVETMEFDKDIGRAKALGAIGKVKDKEDQARLVMRMVIAIGAADGNFDAEEKRVAAVVAKEMGLDPADFDLA